MKGQNKWDIILMTVLRSGDSWDQCHLTPQGVLVRRVVLDSSSELSCWRTWRTARRSVLCWLELGQQVALLMVDLQSGRNLVLRAVVELSKTKSKSHCFISCFDEGGAAEDKDKAVEELNAIIAGTGPNTFHGLLDGTVRYMVRRHRQPTANEGELRQGRLAVWRSRGFCQYVNQWQGEGGDRVFAGSKL